MLDTLGGVAGLAMLTYAALTITRLTLRHHAGRPRLCACTHGPGDHGADGCQGRRIYTVGGAERLLDCRCATYDAAGERAPR